MKLLIFTEGTIIMHGLAKNVSREERVRQSKSAAFKLFLHNILHFARRIKQKTSYRSVYDFEHYIPISNAVNKIRKWKEQGAKINYLTSRRIKSEIAMIKKVLRKYQFPDYKNLDFRKQGENYKDVAERITPVIIIEDDCESIGGLKEMTYPHIKEELKTKIKSIVVREFEGIDQLPDDIMILKQF